MQLPVKAPAGSVIRGTVTFTNSAAGVTATTATAVTGTVTLSSGDKRNFTVGSLAPGASSVQAFTTTVPVTVGHGGTQRHQHGTTTSAERNPANNSATASTVVQFADVTTAVTLPTAPRGPRNFTVGDLHQRCHGHHGPTATGVTGRVTLSNGVVRTYSWVALAPGTSVARSVQCPGPLRHWQRRDRHQQGGDDLGGEQRRQQQRHGGDVDRELMGRAAPEGSSTSAMADSPFRDWAGDRHQFDGQ